MTNTSLKFFGSQVSHLDYTTNMNTTANNTAVSGGGDDTLARITTWFTLVAILATFLFNGLILTAYLTRATLRTPFNAYIANITLAEIILALSGAPYHFIRRYYGYWPYDAVSCSLIVYAQMIFGPAVQYGHVLVSLNRMWAVTFPLHYRTQHTMRCAGWLIAITWVCLHVLGLPVLIRGRLASDSAHQDPQCATDTSQQVVYAVVVEILDYDVPLLFIILSYPYILYKIRRFHSTPAAGNRVAARLLESALSKTNKINNVTNMPDTIDVNIANTSRKVNIRMISNCSSNTNNVVNTSNTSNLKDAYVVITTSKRTNASDTNDTANKNNTVVSESRRTRPRSWRSQNRVLAYMVVGALLGWTPNHVYYLMIDITQQRKAFPTFYAVQYFAQYTLSWVNPILCYLAMTDLREAVNSLTLRVFRQTIRVRDAEVGAAGRGL